MTAFVALLNVFALCVLLDAGAQEDLIGLGLIVHHALIIGFCAGIAVADRHKKVTA